MLDNIINIILIFYITYLNSYNINNYIKRLFKNSIFKILFLFLIILLFDKYLITSILLSIIYIITIDYTYVNDNINLINNIKKYYNNI